MKLTEDMGEELNIMCNLSEGIFESGIEKGEKKGDVKGRAESVRSLMESLDCTQERAMELLKVPVDLQPKILALL